MARVLGNAPPNGPVSSTKLPPKRLRSSNAPIATRSEMQTIDEQMAEVVYCSRATSVALIRSSTSRRDTSASNSFPVSAITPSTTT